MTVGHKAFYPPPCWISCCAELQRCDGCFNVAVIPYHLSAESSICLGPCWWMGGRGRAESWSYANECSSGSRVVKGGAEHGRRWHTPLRMVDVAVFPCPGCDERLSNYRKGTGVFAITPGWSSACQGPGAPPQKWRNQAEHASYK